MLQVGLVLGVHWPAGAGEWFLLAAFSLIGVIAAARAHITGVGLLTAALAVVAFLIIGSVAIPAAAALVLVAYAATSSRRRGAPSRTARSLGAEYAVVMAGLAAYTGARMLIESAPAPAFAHAHDIIAIEQGFGLYFEPDLQARFLEYDTLGRLLNWCYSYAFLAVVGAGLVWLWLVDDDNYRLLRNSLGISALLALVTIALYPVAPPRLVAESGMVDSIVLAGREHAFANQFAAIPSLHVGWIAVTGFVLARSAGMRPALGALVAGAAMLLIVIVTGNHYWTDGVIGSAYAVGAAVVLRGDALRRGLPSALEAARRCGALPGRMSSATWVTLGRSGRARASFISMGLLLGYLLMWEYVEPGFTDYWGYLVAQVAITLVLLIAGEVVFAEEGGLSIVTHVIAVVCSFADVLGTDGNLYAGIDEYDKFTHFAGVAAMTAGIYDILRALARRGSISLDINERFTGALAAGISFGVAWEVYELIGDRVFGTSRVGGTWDTTNDIISDVLGAVAIAALLWLDEALRRAPEEAFGLRSPPGEARTDGAPDQPVLDFRPGGASDDAERV